MKLLVTILLVFAVCTSCGGIRYHDTENVAVSSPAPAAATKTYTRPQVQSQNAEQAQSQSVALPQPETTTTTTSTTYYIPLSSVAYKEVSTSLVGSDTIVDKLLAFGAKRIIKLVNAKHSLSDLSFTVSTVNHLYAKTLGDLIDYKFDVQLTNSEGYYINAIFCATYSKSTGEMKLVSYNWNSGQSSPKVETSTETEKAVIVEDGSSSNVIEAPNTLPEEVARPLPEVETSVVVVESSQSKPAVETCDEKPEVVEVIEQAPKVVEVTEQAPKVVEAAEQAPKVVEATEQAPKSESSKSTTTTTTTTTYIPLSSIPYKEVSTSLVGSDSLVDKLLSFGAEHIVKVANAKSPLGDLTFTVTNVYHLYVKTLEDLIDYKFDVQLNNTQGYYINTVFCVTYDNSTGEMKVVSYKWKSGYYSPPSEATTETVTETTETIAIVKEDSSSNVVEAPNVLPEEAPKQAPEVETIVVVENASNAEVCDDAESAQPVTETKQNPQPEEAPEQAPKVETVVVVENPQPASNAEVCDDAESAQPVAETKQSPQSESTTTTTTTTTYIPLSSVAYKEVSTSLVGSNTLVDQLLSFGAEHIIRVANAKYPLGDLSFTVTSVNHLYVKTLGDLVDYKFDVRLNNTQGYYVDTVFCVTYNNSTGGIEIVSYRWKSARYTPASQTTTTTETVAVTKTESSANVVEAPNILAPEVGTTVVLVEQAPQVAPEAKDCDTGKKSK